MASLLDKKILRRQLLQQRRSLSLEDWQEKSQKLCQQLIQLSLFQSAQTILSYFSIHQEPELNSLCSLQKHWGFARCLEQSLTWHSWQQGETLEIGNYGISEPLDTAPLIEPQTVDLMLIPAIACDYRGYRLGYGGGYYDRLLARSDWHNIPKIGIIFEFAYISYLPTETWDIPLSGVCTENGYYSIRG